MRINSITFFFHKCTLKQMIKTSLLNLMLKYTKKITFTAGTEETIYFQAQPRQKESELWVKLVFFKLKLHQSRVGALLGRPSAGGDLLLSSLLLRLTGWATISAGADRWWAAAFC